MEPAREAFVESVLASMTLDDKIGQCITLEFTGTRITPGLRRKVLEFRCGGLRATPHVHEALPYGVRKKDEGDTQRRSPWAGPAEYAELINELQAMAGSRPGGVPLHVSVDMEGDLSANYARGGVLLLPNQMGLAATGDEGLVREGWRVLARQLRAGGINMLHSPCVDVDFVPNNPTIGVRAFADTPEAVARWAVAMMETLGDEGIIATAKHFPGRGFSKVDTHFGLDVNERSLAELMANEFYPYRRLFEAGLPAVLPSHSMYRAIDPDGVPASVSKRLHEFTRNELDFDGVMATDAIGMAGVLKYFGGSLPKAARAALVAGNDLVLVKTTEDVEPLVIEEMHKALDEGELTETDLDEHVRRVVRMKFDAGLFERYPVDAARAVEPARDPANRQTVLDIAQACCTLLCDDDGLLPLKGKQRVLCVEPYFPLLQDQGNDTWWHSDMLVERIGPYCPAAASREILNGGDEEDIREIVALSEGFDVTVVLCQKFRNGPSSSPVAEALIAAGRKVVVLSTNPYEFSIPAGAGTVLITYGQVPRVLENAAAVLFGRAEPAGVWPLANYNSPFDRLGVKRESVE